MRPAPGRKSATKSALLNKAAAAQAPLPMPKGAGPTARAAARARAARPAAKAAPAAQAATQALAEPVDTAAPPAADAPTGAQPAQAIEAAAELAGAAVAQIPQPINAEAVYTELAPSPLNPRRSMDRDSLAELADSVARHGLLQPIVVRRHAQPLDPVKYEIVCGARRHAAVGLAVAAGAWPTTRRIPIRIVACTDLELVIMAGTENLAREDMAPLDEAELFAAVKRAAPELEYVEIGKRLGVSRRTVFRRLDLLRLVPEARAMLAEDKLSLQRAQALAKGTAEAQATFLNSGWRMEHAEPEQIAREMTRTRVDVKLAQFPLDQYAGEILEDGDGDRYFVDVAQFRRLQDAAVERIKAKLADKRPWVDVVSERYSHTAESLLTYERASQGGAQPDGERGAVILYMADGTVEVHDKMYRPRRGAIANSTAPRAKSEVPREPLSEAQRVAVHAAKTRALQKCVAVQPELALALAIIGLLGGDDHVRVRARSAEGADRIEPHLDPLLRAAMGDLAEVIAEARAKAPRDRAPGADLPPLVWDDDGSVAAAVLAELVTWQPDELMRLQAVLVARQVGSWCGYKAAIGDTALVVELARHCSDLDLVLAQAWRCTPSYLAALPKHDLLQIARAAGLADTRWGHDLKKAEIVDSLAASLDEIGPDVLPELQFASTEAIQKALTPRPAATFAAQMKAEQRQQEAARAAD